jgi:hypothetical protein
MSVERIDGLACRAPSFTPFTRPLSSAAKAQGRSGKPEVVYPQVQAVSFKAVRR